MRNKDLPTNPPFSQYLKSQSILTSKPAVADYNKKLSSFLDTKNSIVQQSLANTNLSSQRTAEQKLASEKSTADKLNADKLALETKKVDNASKSEQDKLKESLGGYLNDSVANHEDFNFPEQGEQKPAEQKVSGGVFTNNTTGQLQDSTGKTVYKDEQGNYTYTEPKTATTTNTLEDVNIQLQKNIEARQQDLENLKNGTYPMSALEKAQIDDIKNQYKILNDQQLEANKNYEAAIGQAGISAGRSRYAPEIQMGIQKQAIDQGIQKISDINSKMISTVNDLEQAYQKDDYTKINDLYNQLDSYQKERATNIKTLNDEAAAQVKAQQDYNQKVSSTIATGMVKVDNSGNVIQPTMDEINTKAAELGILPSVLQGEIATRTDELNKMALEQRKQNFEENKLVDIKLSDGTTISGKWNPITKRYDSVTFDDGGNTVIKDSSTNNGIDQDTGVYNGPSLAKGNTSQEITDFLSTGPSLKVGKAGSMSAATYDQITLYNSAILSMLGAPDSSIGGMGSVAGRSAIGNKAAAIMQAYNISPLDIAAAKIDYKALSGAQVKLTAQSAFINVFANTAKDNLKLVLEQSDNVPRGGAKFTNKYQLWAQGEFTPAGPLATLETYIYTASREYAKVTSGGAMSAQALTESAQKEASKLMNSSQSPEALKSTVNAMIKDMDNVQKEMNKGVSQLPDSIQNIVKQMSAEPAEISKPKTYSSFQDYYIANPDKHSNIEKMIQDNPKLSDDEILQIINSGVSPQINPTNAPSTAKKGSVSFRNNNPLNIKFGDFAKQFGASEGTKATDGGVFANFPDVESGMKAAKKLLSSNSYKDLPLDKALKRWSGNGYGAELVPEFKGKTIAQLSDSELNILINKMKQREGWITA